MERYYPVTMSWKNNSSIHYAIRNRSLCTLCNWTFAQRRLQQPIESRLKSKTERQPSLLVDETKTTIKSKIEVIEKLTDEDFDILIVMLKSLRRALLEDSKIVIQVLRDVVLLIITNLNFAATVVLYSMNRLQNRK